MKRKRINYTIQKYKNKEISLGKGAKLANVSMEKFISLLAEEKIPLNYTKKDLEEDFKVLNIKPWDWSKSNENASQEIDEALYDKKINRHNLKK